MPTSTAQSLRRLSTPQLGFLGFIVALVVPHSMISRGVPEDNAVYTYIGWAMAHGKVPYVQLWDHKGPLLYLIERLGAVVPVPGLGSKLLDFAACALSTWILLWIVNQLVGLRTLLILAVGTILFVAYYDTGGNMTETWAVLFLAFAHYAAWQASRGRWSSYLGAIAGASTAAILWIRPNMIVFAGLAALYIIAAAWHDRSPRESIVQFTGAAVAFVAVSGVVLLPYIRTGAMGAMKAAYLGYNASYSQFISHAERVRTLQIFILEFLAVPMLLSAFVGWVVLIVSLRASSRYELTVPHGYRLLLIASTTLEVMAVMVSGRPYLHYFYVLLPTSLVITALAVQSTGIFNQPVETTRQAELIPLSRIVFVLLIILFAQSLRRYVAEMSGLRERGSDRALIRLIDRISKPDDPIALIGGPETAFVYLHSQRFATSRFFYTLPIIHNALANADGARHQYVADLIATPPKIIASGPTAGTGNLCQTSKECSEVNIKANDEGYNTSVLPAMIQPLLASDYVRLNDPATAGWRIYIRRDVAQANVLPTFPEPDIDRTDRAPPRP